jgi:LDH2 family malate/lactate/ureidoglycolate dehydrogenase
MLVGGLSGGFCPPAPDGAFGDNNVLTLLWDPQRFSGRKHFEHQVAQLVAFVRACPTRAVEDTIRLPGDRSRSERGQRLRDGIPLDGGTWNELTQLATRLQVEIPAVEQRTGS